MERRAGGHVWEQRGIHEKDTRGLDTGAGGGGGVELLRLYEDRKNQCGSGEIYQSHGSRGRARYQLVRRDVGGGLPGGGRYGQDLRGVEPRSAVEGRGGASERTSDGRGNDRGALVRHGDTGERPPHPLGLGDGRGTGTGAASDAGVIETG